MKEKFNFETREPSAEDLENLEKAEYLKALDLALQDAEKYASANLPSDQEYLNLLRQERELSGVEEIEL